MDLIKSGMLLCSLRKAKGLTQKQVADRLGVLPKTVSKWETGHGFPDISTVSALAEILGVSTDTLLSGSLIQNTEESGNMKKTKFYVCPVCGAIMQGTGEAQIICCGKQLGALKAAPADEAHAITICDTESGYLSANRPFSMQDDCYITLNHEMTKAHFISFIAYVCFDRVLTIRLYPEQEASVRFPKMHGGKLYYYCSNHGLFEYVPNANSRKRSAVLP